MTTEPDLSTRVALAMQTHDNARQPDHGMLDYTRYKELANVALVEVLRDFMKLGRPGAN